MSPPERFCYKDLHAWCSSHFWEFGRNCPVRLVTRPNFSNSPHYRTCGALPGQAERSPAAYSTRPCTRSTSWRILASGDASTAQMDCNQRMGGHRAGRIRSHRRLHPIVLVATAWAGTPVRRCGSIALRSGSTLCGTHAVLALVSESASGGRSPCSEQGSTRPRPPNVI